MSEPPFERGDDVTDVRSQKATTNAAATGPSPLGVEAATLLDPKTDDLRINVGAAAADDPRTAPNAETDPESLRQIHATIRNHTGHDFSGYKSGTIGRGVERRRTLHQMVGLAAYAAHLQHHPAEVELLYREVLIGVTSFFRDPDSFDALAKLLPALLDEVAEGGTLRV